MIAIHMIDGRFVPLLTCETCGRRIEDPEMAVVVFDLHARARQIPRFAHKGVCHDAADERIRQAGGYPGWNECGRWMMDLLHNTGLHGEALERAVASSTHAAEFGL